MCFAKHFTFLPYTEFSSFNGNKMHFLPTDPVEIFKSHLDMVLDKQFQVALLGQRVWTR